MANKLKIIPLGGLGEIGKNMTVFEYGRNIILVDCGAMFPENDMWGIDLVIPDFAYLRDKLDLIRGVILTHGHEDHTGALPYLLKEASLPIYSTKLTRGLVEVKLKRAGLLDRAALNTIQAGDVLNLGPFEINFFEVSHSIPDGVGLAIRTPAGMIVHTGDFKLDIGAELGAGPDLSALARLGQEGVLLLMADSTGSERPGFTPPERIVEETLEEIFANAPGRVIVATFASLLSRVQQVIDVAVRQDRKVAVNGRSMIENVAMAQEMGYLRVPPDTLIDAKEIDRYAPNRVAIMATGSQGEPRATLALLATGAHRQLEIRPDDTVVLSSQMIPGNEEAIIRIINQLIDRGADVIYDKIAPVHVSGHGSQEDQKLLIRLFRPHYLMPIHGESRHLHQHGRLAQQIGVPKDHILVLKDGSVLEVEEKRVRVVDQVEQETVFVDGSVVGDIGPVVLRDREVLARDGFVVAVLAADANGANVRDVQIVSRGFVYLRESEELIQRIREEALRVAGESARAVPERVQRALERFLEKETGRQPLVMCVIAE
ncbi:MAG: ribonuclease J [Chloroflexi bacterium]|nr:ribonuclease J [Chloroflexota bacterium]